MDQNFMTESIRPEAMSSNHRMDDLFQHVHIVNMNSPIISAQYLSDDAFIALGCQDGCILVISSSKGDVQYILKNTDKSPISGLAFNPNSLSIKNAVMCVHTEGTLQYWHATSKQLLFSRKYNQLLHACEISHDGQYYVLAGDSGNLKLGNMNKDSPSDMQTGHIGAHINRVFCLKWHPNNPNIFLSGGWDKTVFTWDIRVKTAVNKLYGMYIGGQAIDVCDNQIVLGNNSKEYPLRIYDTKANKIRSINWPFYSEQEEHHQTGVLCCCFGYNGKSQILATSAHRQIRYFKDQKCISLFEYENQQAKVYCLSRSLSSRSIITGWSDGVAMIMMY